MLAEPGVAGHPEERGAHGSHARMVPLGARRVPASGGVRRRPGAGPRVQPGNGRRAATAERAIDSATAASSAAWSCASMRPAANSSDASTNENSPTWLRPTATWPGRPRPGGARDEQAGQRLAGQQQGRDDHQPADARAQRGWVEQGAHDHEEQHREHVPEGQQTAAHLGRVGRVGDDEAAHERGERERDAEDDRTHARGHQTAGDGHDEEQVRVGPQRVEDPGQQAGGDDRERPEQRATPGAPRPAAVPRCPRRRAGRPRRARRSGPGAGSSPGARSPWACRSCAARSG